MARMTPCQVKEWEQQGGVSTIVYMTVEDGRLKRQQDQT